MSDVPPGAPTNDPRPALQALVDSGRRLQSDLAALQNRLAQLSGLGDAPGIVIAVDEVGLVSGLEFGVGWRDAGEAGMLSQLDAAFTALPVPEPAVGRLSSIGRIASEPQAVTDSLGEIVVHALLGKVLRVEARPGILVAATDATLADILIPLARRAALETDSLGRYARAAGEAHE